jgi:hypothetical protein
VSAQRDLFDPPPRPPFARHSATSRLAAASIEKAAKSQRLRLLLWLEERGPEGGTQEEAANALRFGRPTACARFYELEQVGLAVKTGRTRPTASGRAAIVYVYRSIIK